MIAQTKVFATMQPAIASWDSQEPIALLVPAPMSALDKASVLTGPVSAILVSWEKIVPSRDVKVDVATTSTVMMDHVLATLD